MPDITGETDIADRRQRAVTAAVAAGRDLGLTVTDPVVLHDVFSVLVHLAPSPVVVRVPVVLPSATDAQAQDRMQTDELAVVAWLAERGVPVVPPSPLVPTEPVRRNGFGMTMWQLVHPIDSPDDNPADIADLHAAMRDYPGELPFLSAFDTMRSSLTELEGRPDLATPRDLDRAHGEWDVLEPWLRDRAGFESRFPGATTQPVHGDAPGYNVITTADRKLFADFECVTIGPVERDLSLVSADGVAAYNEAASRCGLRRLDPTVRTVMAAAGLLQAFATLSLVPQLPMLAEGLKPLLDQWRASPSAGGLAD
ncbi:MAG: phosphotransferase [Stackebrandtia sp.]